jgi:hypothetical protein
MHIYHSACRGNFSENATNFFRPVAEDEYSFAFGSLFLIYFTVVAFEKRGKASNAFIVILVANRRGYDYGKDLGNKRSGLLP